MPETGSAVNKDQEKDFDQFYTRDVVAEECLTDTIQVLQMYYAGYSMDDLFFLEPSAGDGAFLRAFEKTHHHRYFACDIDPHNQGIVKRDFLVDDLTATLPARDNIVVIGNPPFGKRARLAAAFVNRALEYANTVAFILPLQFQKHSAQHKLIKSARLVFDRPLAPDSFVFNGKIYPVRCCFQIWTTLSFGNDLRLRSAPVTKHPDFEMWQYNNTREAEKYFDKERYAWDFAIPRQGYKDYTLKETDPAKMDHRTQWIFFKAKSPTVLTRLHKIDYDKLSKKNTSIPGFGKADVIKEYTMLFGDPQPTVDEVRGPSRIGLATTPKNTSNISTLGMVATESADASATKEPMPDKDTADFGNLPLGALLNC